MASAGFVVLGVFVGLTLLAVWEMVPRPVLVTKSNTKGFASTVEAIQAPVDTQGWSSPGHSTSGRR
ncbi:MAG TPA: hypothetical protein PLO37_09115 [Candidatus Hydrogenedentes bacterium]|nr:hypothetical protein [Candidatus Hydrogenedentota bacterium]HPG66992.1 hypothetical protein [Candidatus Hydrogenedentota bacterium]